MRGDITEVHKILNGVNKDLTRNYVPFGKI